MSKDKQNGNAAAPVAAEAIAAAIEAPAKQKNANPYFDLFESHHFSVSDSDKVFENERNGMRQKRLANVAFILVGGFATIPGSVYLKQAKGGKPYVEVTFFGNMQNTAIKPVDEASKLALAEYRRHVAEDYKRWREGQAQTTTPKVSTGVEIAGLSLD
jgi:hypothetical protein